MQGRLRLQNDPFSIIGAGIAGLTMGIALTQQGSGVRLYEGADQIKPVGAGIAMANNAMQIFSKMGVSARIAASGHRISRMRITDEALRDLSVANLDAYERRYGVCNLAIHRGALQQILAETLGYEHIHLSKRLRIVDQVSEGCLLHFDDGTSADSRYLIGADGIRSVVRAQVFSRGQIRFSGQKCWRGVCDYPFGAGYLHEAVEAWGRGKRFGFVRIDDRRVYWYAVLTASGEGEPAVDLSECFAGFHPDVTDIIQRTDRSQVYFSDINELASLGRWNKGRVCLIGDAAHAMTPNMGQGACQAVEDAYVLGRLLAESDDVAGAFNRYYALRKQKVSALARQSRATGLVSQLQHPVAAWLRNRAMRMAPARMMEHQLGKVFDISLI